MMFLEMEKLLGTEPAGEVSFEVRGFSHCVIRIKVRPT